MRDGNGGTGGMAYRMLSGMLGWIARLVPPARRAAWLEEWRAEVWHGLQPGGRGFVRTGLRVGGAVADAMAVRRAEQRRTGSEGILGGLVGDARLAVRSLARARGFAVTTAVILAVGIGLNTAVLTLAWSSLAGPLPFRDADRLVRVWERRPEQGRERNPVSLPDFVDWRAGATSFASMAAMHYEAMNLSGVGIPRTVSGIAVTRNLFSMLGVEPDIGRVFGADDQDGDHVVVLGHRLWIEAFGGDRGVVGRTVQLDTEPYTVVGVMPARFGFPGPLDYWIPLVDDVEAASRGSHRYEVIARLAPGATLQHASDELDALAHSLERSYPDTNTGHYASVFPMRDEMLDGRRSVFFLLTGAVGLILLVACVNVANMELVRSAARARDLAVRAALGASRGRLLRQLTVESLVLSAAAVVLSLPVAMGAWRLLQRSTASGVSWVAADPLQPGALATAAGLGVLTALIFGLMPAFRASRPDLANRLQEGAPRSGLGRAGVRWQGALVVTQVGLAVALLAGAGLLTRSLLGLLAVDPGLDPAGVVTADVALPEARYPDAAGRLAFFTALEERARTLPGAAAVGSTSILPMGDRETGRDFQMEEGTEPYPGAWNTRLRIVDGDYFQALRMRLLRGRRFGAADVEGAPRVGIVNETAVRRYWPEGGALGRRVRFGAEEPWITVVGVVNDVRHAGPSRPIEPELYLPLAQSPVAFQTLVVRSDAPPGAVVEGLRAEVSKIDADQPLASAGSYEDRVRRIFAYRRELAGTLVGFAALALLLAGMGIYGVVSHTVVQRRHEYGIRMALGGSAGRVVRGVVGGGARLVAVGTVVGLALFAAGSKLVRGLLFGVGPFDPATLTVTTTVLVAVALIAVWIPARGTTRVSPSESLRG